MYILIREAANKKFLYPLKINKSTRQAFLMRYKKILPYVTQKRTYLTLNRDISA